ncbi:hypothetical protein [Faecalispora jeddahensis]|uniref:hypothetical protein n=1 Tax=Faecalispora jeddahensis TaxID=1414721 RepID=UPI0027BB19F9|nr:hypothetical protein [Faecalispora jeddahensis]
METLVAVELQLRSDFLYAQSSFEISISLIPSASCAREKLFITSSSVGQSLQKNSSNRPQKRDFSVSQISPAKKWITNPVKRLQNWKKIWYGIDYEKK